ncbi:unnamed protein product [Lactuca saligna]|uniref:Uncharacterized protein n=1 Tax=Lactuca saligna TaxID=75948 RepID=A0AA36ED61_LACSI|nr:unnamed protein product [Lactuca saligna]
MASSPSPTDQNFIVVDFHYNGTFIAKPLVYFDPDRASMRDVDFNSFDSEDQDDKYVPPQYPMQDDRKLWDHMKPMIGIRFSNPTELKPMLINYAIANGGYYKHLRKDVRKLNLDNVSDTLWPILKKRFTSQQYKKWFWRAVWASTVEKFTGVMDKIKSIDTHAYDYIINRYPTTYYKAFFQEGNDCDAVENRVSESFNFAIRNV